MADNPFNVIADHATLIGTARSFNDNVRDILEKEIEAVVKGVCACTALPMTTTTNADTQR